MVQKLLEQDLKRYSKLDALLDAVHMSRATLYRKLKEEQSTCSELVATVRIEYLRKVSSREFNNMKIADELGFSELSSYYKFLKRTPP